MVCKAIIPTAGLGTRFLPATKIQTKEMLQIVDKLALKHIIEDVVYFRIEEILAIIVKIVNYFDKSAELEFELGKKGKDELLEEVRKIFDMVNIHYIHQKEPKVRTFYSLH